MQAKGGGEFAVKFFGYMYLQGKGLGLGLGLGLVVDSAHVRCWVRVSSRLGPSSMLVYLRILHLTHGHSGYSASLYFHTFFDRKS